MHTCQLNLKTKSLPTNNRALNNIRRYTFDTLFTDVAIFSLFLQSASFVHLFR